MSQTPRPAPIISIEHVSKLYGSIAAVRDVTLHVRPGEVLGLLGPNGSGKTTLLRMLTGYLSPTTGRLSVAGYDTERQRMEARRRIGYVPESLPLYSHMRVGEFLRFMARLRQVPVAAVEAAVRRVAELLALGDMLRKPIRALSR